MERSSTRPITPSILWSTTKLKIGIIKFLGGPNDGSASQDSELFIITSVMVMATAFTYDAWSAEKVVSPKS